jgi:hypothetical protein
LRSARRYRHRGRDVHATADDHPERGAGVAEIADFERHFE